MIWTWSSILTTKNRSTFVGNKLLRVFNEIKTKFKKQYTSKTIWLPSHLARCDGIDAIDYNGFLKRNNHCQETKMAFKK